MTIYRTILTADNVDGCPLYKKGDKIVVNLPDLDMESTDKVCAFALAALLHKKAQGEKNMICEKKEDFASKQAYMTEFQISEDTLYCPRIHGEVTFSVRVEARDDDITLLQEFAGRADKQALIAKLKKIPIFAAVKADDLFDILPDLKMKKFDKNEIILEKGQTGRHLFVIYQGEVEVIQMFKDVESVIGHIKSGDCFGEMSLLTGEPVSATIRASAPSAILMLERQAFRKLLETTPQMGLMFTKLLAQRIKNTNQRMSMVVASGMVGQLQTIPFPELIQTLCSTDCTGILHLNRQGQQAKIYIQNGQVIDVNIDERHGEESFYELLKWQKGDFRFEQKEFQVARTVAIDIMSMLLEGMRRLDEETKRFTPGDLPNA